MLTDQQILIKIVYFKGIRWIKPGSGFKHTEKPDPNPNKMPKSDFATFTFGNGLQLNYDDTVIMQIEI